MKSYIKKNLLKYEYIIHQSNIHWIINIIPKYFLSSFILRKTTEYVITDRRIIVKKGIFSRKIIEINIKAIESIKVNQSLLGKIFNYGFLTVIGLGGTNECFKYLNKPLEFKKVVLGLM